VDRSQPRAVPRLAAIKRPFKFKVRHFDEAVEDAAVTRYCRKYVSATDDTVIRVFRNMRQALASQQGQERETWLQVLLIGDVAIAGVPAEYFTQLGLDIKNRSPFRSTFVAELANDWIGYLPDRTGHKLGGYQVWTGYHSYAEPGTGERIVDEVTAMLRELEAGKTSDSPPARPQAKASTPAAAALPLQVSSSNPRYFCDPSGKAVYLTGSHTWNSLQEIAPATRFIRPTTSMAWKASWPPTRRGLPCSLWLLRP
jgi:hypothetical protein